MLSCFVKDFRQSGCAQVECSIHQLYSDVGNFVPSGTRDSYDEAMPPEQAQLSIQFGGTSFPFDWIVRAYDCQTPSQIRCLETFNEMLSPHNGLKEHPVSFSQWVEASDSLLGQFLRFAQAVQLSVRFRRVIDLRQRLQVGPICPKENVTVKFHAADTLRHGKTIYGLLAATGPTDAELPGTVDDRLDTQYNPLLVVHFDPVTPHDMLDSSHCRPILCIRLNHAVKRTVKLPTHETHDVFGLCADSGVLLPIQIQLIQYVVIAKHYIRSIFGLVNDPVIFHPLEYRLEQRIDTTSKDMQNLLPWQCRKTVGDGLRFSAIRDGNKGVFHLPVRDTFGCQLSGKPVVTVHVNLNRKRQPGAHSDMHETKMPVQVVKVQRQTARRTLLQAGTAFSISKRKSVIFFIHRQNANQPFRDAVPLCYLPDIFFFTDISIQVFVRPILFLSHSLRMHLQCLSLRLCKILELFQENTPQRKEPLRSLWIAHRQISLQDQPVRYRYSSCNRSLVLLQKIIHSVHLLFGSVVTPLSESERYSFINSLIFVPARPA